MSRKMPVQKPGRSETVVVTPQEFVHAAASYLGFTQFEIDLAATKKNTRAQYFISKEDGHDSLLIDWGERISGDAWGWLNPPYDDISPWVQRAARFKQRCKNDRYGFVPGGVAVLVPSSTGTNWWRDYVHNKAYVLLLNGRITFLDKMLKPICSQKTGKPTPYPKDLALLLYSVHYKPGYDIWDWKRS
jgi:phage N-6-adenine-methyltransferase